MVEFRLVWTLDAGEKVPLPLAALSSEHCSPTCTPPKPGDPRDVLIDGCGPKIPPQPPQCARRLRLAVTKSLGADGLFETRGAWYG